MLGLLALAGLVSENDVPILLGLAWLPFYVGYAIVGFRTGFTFEGGSPLKQFAAKPFLIGFPLGVAIVQGVYRM